MEEEPFDRLVRTSARRVRAMLAQTCRAYDCRESVIFHSDSRRLTPPAPAAPPDLRATIDESGAVWQAPFQEDNPWQRSSWHRRRRA